MRVPGSRLLVVLSSLVLVVSALAGSAGIASAATYVTYVAQSPANPTSADTVHVWVNSDTVYGEYVGLQYHIGGTYTMEQCSYDNTDRSGADWRCDIPSQPQNTYVEYQLFVYNQSNQPYDWTGFNWNYTTSAAPTDNIHWNGLFSDQSPFFMNPVEPVQGGSLTLRFRSAHSDLTSLNVNWYDSANPNAGWNNWIPMHLIGTDVTGKYDFWQADASALLATASTKFYRFQANQNSATTWYNAFGPTCGSGSQTNGCQAPSSSNFWVIPGFHVPGWSKSAIFYQIFPDRFRNGDPSNDIPFHSSTAVAADSQGKCPAGSYNYDGNCAYTHNSWNELPTQPGLGIDFYGGDLAGITQEIDPYLKQTLGVNALYLNPIFESPTNHKYDTQDYYTVDPHFGTNTGSGPGSLTSLIGAAHSSSDFSGDSRMSVMLDGVFNHTGDWNCWFNRVGNNCGSDPGAFQSASSQYRNWYKFLSGFDPVSAPNNYCSWSGFGNLPQLNYSSPGVRNAIYQGQNSVMRTYLSAPYNIDGWRLDVADNYSDLDSASSPCQIGNDNHQIWQDIRSYLKGSNATANGLQTFPESLILGEYWQKPTDWLGGDQWDSVMNYNGFGTPVSNFFTGQGVHGEANQSLSPSGLRAWLVGTLADNNRSSQLAMLNSLTTHDISRFLYRACTAVGGSSSQCAASNTTPDAAFDKLKMAIEMQMTYVGMPSIYYGDEIGTTGSTDPDNRRTFDWNTADWNRSVLDLTRILTHNRSSHEAWQDGSFIPLVTDDTNDVFAYGRVLYDPTSIGSQAGIGPSDAAVVAFNNSSTQQTETIDATQVGLTDGTVLTDLVGGGTVTVSGGTLQLTLPANTGMVLTPSPTQVASLPLPGKPVNLQAQTSGGTVTLTWNPPTSGGPVYSYDVTATQGTVGTESCDGSTPSLCTVSVSGVDATQPNTISVAASNESGDGPAATVSIIGAARVSLGNLNATYDGNPHYATVTTTPAGLNVSTTYTDASNNAVAAPTHAGSYSVTAMVNQSGYSGIATGTLTIAQASQSITFPQIPDQHPGTPDFDPGASASSGLPISYQGSGACTISPSSQVHLTGTGQCTVTASQSGNSDYLGAQPVTQSFNVGNIRTSVTLDTSSLTATYDGGPHYATASTDPSDLSVSITYSDAHGNPVTAPTEAGSYGVTATVTSTGYTGSTTGTLVIQPAGQTITFGAIGDQVYGTSPFALSATASSGLAVTFSTQGNCSVLNGVLTLTGAGSCTVTADQGGDNDYSAAASVSQTFSIAQGTATLTVDQTSLSQTYDGTGKSVSVTTTPAGLSGVTVTYNGSTTTPPTEAGTYPFTAALNNPNYTAQSVSGQLTILPESQTISFGAVPNHTYGDADFAVTPTASSGLPVSIAVGAGDPCTVVSGLTIHLTGVGTCTVTASQSGNSDVMGAQPVVQAFAINPAGTSLSGVAVATSGANPAPQFGDTVTLQTTVAPNATSTGNGVFAGMVTFSVNGTPVGTAQTVSNGSPSAQVTVPLNASLIPAGAGIYAVSASFSPAGGNYAAGTSPAAQTFTVEREGQRADGSADGSVRLAYSGDRMVTLGHSPSLQATLLQSQAPESDDTSFVDFGSASVSAVFKLYPAACAATCSWTPLWSSSPVSVTDGADWSASGAGVASVLAPSNLPVGPYIVGISLVSNGYVLGETATSAFDVAPTAGHAISGGGTIVKDSTSNAQDPSGAFAVSAYMSGRTIQGANAYIFRQRMDVSQSTGTSTVLCTVLSSTCRDVDVVVRANHVSGFHTGTNTSYPRTGYVSGSATVTYLDAADGVTQYPRLAIVGGLFRVDVTDKSSTGAGDLYGLSVYRGNGTLVHQAFVPATRPLPERGVLYPTNQTVIASGNVTVQPN